MLFMHVKHCVSKQHPSVSSSLTPIFHARCITHRSTSAGRLLSTSRIASARPSPIQSLLYQRFAENARSKNPVWRTPLFRYGSGVVVVGGGVYYYTHLEHVQLTNRSRFMNVSSAQEAEASKVTYDEIMAQYGRAVLPDSHPSTQFVKKVAARLIRASGLNDLKWEVHVIQSDEVNAFVIPGGKIFVFSGLLPIAKNENGLATVLGHEIAHQLARHIAEKMSFNPILQVAQLGVVYGLASLGLPTNLAYGFGSSITSVVLDNPYSRMHETEADHIGLLLMAQACFDPREAKQLWLRMSQAGGASVPQFMSTHPSNDNRVVAIEGWMKEALEKREQSDCSAQLGGFLGAMRENQSYANF